MISQFESICMVESYEEELKQRAETRRALKEMLELIAENSDYISRKTDSSMIGAIYDSVWVLYSD